MIKPFIAALIFTSFSAIAQNPDIFLGKYSIAPGDKCRMGVDATRTYVTIHMNRGINEISIQAFGPESQITVIPVQSGIVPSPGTRAEDNVTDTIQIKWANDMSMTSTVTTDAPSMNIRYTETFTLVTNGKRLRIKKRASNDPARSSTCVLVRK